MKNFLNEVFEVESLDGCQCENCTSKKGKYQKEREISLATNCKIVNLTSDAIPLKEKIDKNGKKIRDATISKDRPPRKLQNIDSVVLHAMGFKARDKNNLRNYLKVRAHFIVMDDGKIGQLYSFPTNLNASDRFNNRSIAIEFAGNFKSTREKCHNPKKNGCHNVTEAQINAGRCLLSNLKSTLPNLKFVLAHSQTAPNKGNDPGPYIWFNLGEWAIKNLGFDPKSKNITGTNRYGRGNPIPKEWQNWGKNVVPQPISPNSCTPMEELLQEVFPSHLNQCNPGTDYIQSFPTPGYYYKIKSGDTLTTIAAKAYGSDRCSGTWSCAKKINDHKYNQQFWRRDLAGINFKDGRISMNPSFRGMVELPSAKIYSAPRGNKFGIIWIPK